MPISVPSVSIRELPVTELTRPTFLRRKLGAKLRRMREQAGFTLAAAAPQLDRKRSALHRVETGETRADVHLVKSMMDLYDHFDPDVLDEAREALRPPWYKAYGVKDLGYIDVETQAAQVCQFLLVDLPGLLQTEAYMRALFKINSVVVAQDIANGVIVRRIRQQRLTDADRPLKLVAVVHEAALRRNIGGPKVMREQLCRLVEMTKLPSVTLQVMPVDGNEVPVSPANFTLVDFPDLQDPELLYVEHVSGALHIENPEAVKEAKMAFDRLREGVLSPADSVALIKRLASNLNNA
jgi:Domain of unknown function (DUF5753)/Helix-turn-helix domain